MSLFPFVLYLLSVIGGIVIMLEEECNAVSPTLWVLVVVFPPVVGLLLYIIFGYSLRYKQPIDVKVWKALPGAATETQSLPSTDVAEDTDRALQSLSSLIESVSDTPLTTAYKLMHYDDSRAWFLACREAVLRAKRYIYIGLYRIKNGPWLDILLDLLVEHIQEEVSLYWLYGDVGSRNLSRRYRKRMAQLGGQAAAFFPVRSKLLASHVNYRNHRNLAVVDGAVGFTGRSILLSELSHLRKGFFPLATTHLRISGPAIRQLEYSFTLGWCVATQQLPSLRQFPAMRTTSTPAQLQIFLTHPTGDLPSLEMIFTHAFLQTRQSPYIEAPVLIPTSSIQRALISTASSGIQARITLPRRGRSRLAPKASYALFADLLRAGVEIYYYGGSREAIYAVVDGESVLTGTSHLDFGSFEHDFDLTTIACFSEIARQFIDSFEGAHSLYHRVSWRRNRFWQRIVYGVMRLLTPLP